MNYTSLLAVTLSLFCSTVWYETDLQCYFYFTKNIWTKNMTFFSLHDTCVYRFSIQGEKILTFFRGKKFKYTPSKLVSVFADTQFTSDACHAFHSCWLPSSSLTQFFFILRCNIYIATEHAARTFYLPAVHQIFTAALDVSFFRSLDAQSRQRLSHISSTTKCLPYPIYYLQYSTRDIFITRDNKDVVFARNFTGNTNKKMGT